MSVPLRCVSVSFDEYLCGGLYVRVPSESIGVRFQLQAGVSRHCELTDKVSGN